MIDRHLDVTSWLQPERAALLALLRGLSADDWKRSTECPEWDVKGIALHVLGDDLSLLSRQRDVFTDGLTMFAVDRPGLSFRALLDGFNEQWVTAAQFFSNELLIEMLGLVGDWSHAFYCDVGFETRAREAVGLFADTEPSAYWKVIAREYIERFVHQSQIRRAVGAPDLDGALATAAARATVHMLAAWMLNDAPAVGSAIALDYGEVGGWTCKRDAEGWVVLEGADRAAAARISVAPDRVVALTSRGIAQPDIPPVLAIAGDASLARIATDIIVPLCGPPSARAE